MTDIVDRLRAATPGTMLSMQVNDLAALREAAAEIERLLAAIKRIDSINDNPAIYNQDIEDVIQKIFPTEFGGHQQSRSKE